MLQLSKKTYPFLADSRERFCPFRPDSCLASARRTLIVFAVVLHTRAIVDGESPRVLSVTARFSSGVVFGCDEICEEPGDEIELVARLTIFGLGPDHECSSQEESAGTIHNS